MNNKRINEILSEWLKDFENYPVTNNNDMITKTFNMAVLRKAIKKNYYVDAMDTIKNNLDSPLDRIRSEAKELIELLKND